MLLFKAMYGYDLEPSYDLDIRDDILRGKTSTDRQQVEVVLVVEIRLEKLKKTR